MVLLYAYYRQSTDITVKYSGVTMDMTQTQTPKPVAKIVYAYTQHDLTITVIEKTCGVNIIRLKQDRSKDPVEDVLTQIAIPYMVVPYDYMENVKQKVWLMELSGKLLAVANVPPQTAEYEYTALPKEVAQNVIEQAPWVKSKTLKLDKPITVIEGYVPIVLYAVLPVDKAVELKQRAPWLKILLLQLDGKIVEKLTGRPYDPKSEYPEAIIRTALKVFEVKGGQIRYMKFFEEMVREISKGFKKVGIFNDVMREAFRLALHRLALQSLGNDLELVKTCNGDSGCAEINPLGIKSGYRISFTGTAGRLAPEQMAEMLLRGEARIYYAEIEAQEVPLCAH